MKRYDLFNFSFDNDNEENEIPEVPELNEEELSEIDKLILKEDFPNMEQTKEIKETIDAFITKMKSFSQVKCYSNNGNIQIEFEEHYPSLKKGIDYV